jgi:hypothetical protein
VEELVDGVFRGLNLLQFLAQAVVLHLYPFFLYNIAVVRMRVFGMDGVVVVVAIETG